MTGPISVLVGYLSAAYKTNRAGGEFKLPSLSSGLRRKLLLIAAASGVLIIGGTTVSYALNHQSLGDLATYVRAAREMAAGRTPYDSGALSTLPYDQALYRYPPVLASLLIPLAWWPISLTGLIYSAALWGSLWVGLWLSAKAGIARAEPWLAGDREVKVGIDGLLAITALSFWFLPVWAMLWSTNTEGFMVLATGVSLYAAGSVGRGAALTAAAMLKVSPVLSIPALLARHGVRSLLVVVVTAALLAVPALIWAPASWLNTISALLATSLGGTELPWNIAPVSVVHGMGPIVEMTARFGSLLSAAVLLFVSVWAARRDNGWPAAMCAATAASLLVPSIMWEHYFVLLLPFAVAAWPGASDRLKAVLIGATVVLTVGDLTVIRLLVLTAAVVGTAAILAALWPYEERRRSESDWGMVPRYGLWRRDRAGRRGGG